ncbi:RES domain-containing protein [Caldimonas brevitalea]|uniref:RES domain-containing protein n=1 Tax=Caldimonas brevitalea TaxID=413882 RepID=A0A0G3BXC7_9BURK|nr:RES domain-containing protein [Caldimonas brevitalea]AKJ32026.1 hypothetical protein AAW51_5335 [Caldimonas brevitalea]
MTPFAFSGRELELELLEPGSTLVRLFRHPGGEWEPPPARSRLLRVDPPDGQQDAYAVLYTGETLLTVAIECGVLRADLRDRYSWHMPKAREYRVVRYRVGAPVVFIPIDGRNRRTLGLAGSQREFLGYAPYRAVAHELHHRYGAAVHGLSWESFHRNQPGRVYALWHEHKATVELKIISPPPYELLIDDGEWIAFIENTPDIEGVDDLPST